MNVIPPVPRWGGTTLPGGSPAERPNQAVTVDRLSGGRMVLGVGPGEPPSEYTAIGRDPDRRLLASMLDEGLDVVAGLWSGKPFSHRGKHYRLDDVQFLPPPQQHPRVPVWVSAVARNERTLGRAGRWDGVLLAALSAEGGVDVLPADAVAEVAARPDAPADIVVAAPIGSDPAPYEQAGATWMLVTGWLDELREVSTSRPPRPRRVGVRRYRSVTVPTRRPIRDRGPLTRHHLPRCSPSTRPISAGCATRSSSKARRPDTASRASGSCSCWPRPSPLPGSSQTRPRRSSAP